MDKYFVPVCTSTNDLAKFFLEGGKKLPLVVWAKTQTKGRGQQRRIWVSEEGGLYCSFALEKQDSKKALVLGALASYRTLITYVPCKIRFPNDLMVEGKKIGGVLVEQTSSATVIGIGVNINQKGFPDDLKRYATSLFLEKGLFLNLEEVLDILIKNVQDLHLRDYESLFSEYEKLLFLKSRCTIHLKGGRGVDCKIEGVDKDLLIYTELGKFPLEEVIWIEWER